MTKAPLSALRLLELVRYNPGDGTLVSLVRRGTRVAPGQVLGTPNRGGYLEVGIDKSSYYVHRLAVLYMTGKMPAGDVDHIDGDPSNNRWANLRIIGMAVNQQNRKGSNRNSQTKLLGAFPHGDGRWRAQIMAFGTRRSLGLFSSAEEAHAAYVAAKRRLHVGGTI